MSIIFDDEFHGVGGSYEVRDGKRVRVHETKERAAPETSTPNIASDSSPAAPAARRRTPGSAE